MKRAKDPDQFTMSPEADDCSVIDRLCLNGLGTDPVPISEKGCGLILILDCPKDGISIDRLSKRLYPGEIALVAPRDHLLKGSKGEMLAVQLKGVGQPDCPRHLRDRLLEALLKRAWASLSVNDRVVTSTLRLIEDLVVEHVRARQEQFSLREQLDPRIAAALDHLDQHYGTDLSVNDLAAVACLSPGHFGRLFKKQMGVSAWSHVQQRRCQAAYELLQETDTPIAMVAYDCGFSSQAHLTSTFRREYGRTPGDVRPGG